MVVPLFHIQLGLPLSAMPCPRRAPGHTALGPLPLHKSGAGSALCVRHELFFSGAIGLMAAVGQDLHATALCGSRLRKVREGTLQVGV
jgi:hypothetical protein